MNMVMTGSGRFVEVQGAAEHDPFSSIQMASLIRLAKSGISELVRLQNKLVRF